MIAPEQALLLTERSVLRVYVGPFAGWVLRKGYVWALYVHGREFPIAGPWTSRAKALSYVAYTNAWIDGTLPNTKNSAPEWLARLILVEVVR